VTTPCCGARGQRSPAGNLVEGTLLLCLRRIEKIAIKLLVSSAELDVKSLVCLRELFLTGLWTHWWSQPTGLNKPCPLLEDWNRMEGGAGQGLLRLSNLFKENYSYQRYSYDLIVEVTKFHADAERCLNCEKLVVGH